VKAFIIFRDRLTYGRQCLAALQAAGLEPVIADFGTTYPAALDWLNTAGVPVLYHGDGGPRQLWAWEPFLESVDPADRFVVTDPDTVPDEDCPADWPQHLSQVLSEHGVKAALGLRIDDIPEHYPRRAQVLEWEGQFWKDEIAPGVYDGGTDTTLAVCPARRERPGHVIGGVRTGKPYVCRHLAWYEDPAALPEDVAWYYAHLGSGIAHWTIGGPSVWGS
jgi:hypothetical protein